MSNKDRLVRGYRIDKKPYLFARASKKDIASPKQIIGVFDSGVGGLSVANAIKKAFPEYEVLLREDSENLPYGTKTPDELYGLVLPILQNMIQEGCIVIVIACNTVTTTLISRLRQELSIPLVGMEPMVKPAAEQTKTGVIAVCATLATLKSERYQWLKSEYCKNVAVYEPDCSDWASMIQNNQVERTRIEAVAKESLARQADVIVLGCTHYHWIEELIRELAEGRALVVQSEQPVIKQLRRVLADLA